MKRQDARAEADRPAAVAIAAAEGGAPVRPGPVAPSWAAASPHARMLLTLRLRRRRRFLLRLAVFVGLPTLATAGHFLLFASPRYVAQLQLTYQPVQSLSAGLVQSVAGTSHSNSVDLGAIIHQYGRAAAPARRHARPAGGVQQPGRGLDVADEPARLAVGVPARLPAAGLIPTAGFVDPSASKARALPWTRPVLEGGGEPPWTGFT